MAIATEQDLVWKAFFAAEFQQEYIQKLKTFLEEERRLGAEIYPPQKEVFQAFTLSPFDAMRVVIIGQDPYHGPGEAHGLCFSVKPGVKIPPSLKNIIKELEEDVGIPAPSHGCLQSWAEQGVLLLNATLTVRKGEARSHFGKGWETFTDRVVEKIRDREDPVVFLLWGRHALEKVERVLAKKPHPHLLLTAAHPSPLAGGKFAHCKHFSKTNEALVRWGKQPIDWRIV